MRQAMPSLAREPAKNYLELARTLVQVYGDLDPRVSELGPDDAVLRQVTPVNELDQPVFPHVIAGTPYAYYATLEQKQSQKVAVIVITGSDQVDPTTVQAVWRESALGMQDNLLFH